MAGPPLFLCRHNVINLTSMLHLSVMHRRYPPHEQSVMRGNEVTDLTQAYNDGDVDTNLSDNPTIHSIIDARYSRRAALFSAAKATAALSLGGFALVACGEGDNVVPHGDLTVNAGANGTAASGQVVTLSGTASKYGAAIMNYAWAQISGPTTALTNANTATATFIAPSVSTSTPLIFRLTATDSDGQSSSAETTVTVTPAALGFTAVAKNLNDVVTVPAGYNITILYRLGDPINAATGAYANDGSDASFEFRAGDHHDGMSFFGLAATGNTPNLSNSSRGVLVMNHENITQRYLHVNGPTTTNGQRPVAEVLKEIMAHGISAIEVMRGSTGEWAYVQNSALNRRINPFTPTSINGPLRGHALMKTAYSPTGEAGRGTINNCANGYLPWGTYATCEENWVGYFRRDAGDDAVRTAAGNAKSVTSLNRYGSSGVRAGNYGWTTATPVDAGDTRFAKFNATADATKAADGTGDFRNEINQYGWVVEIDPYNPAATPRKRTALGRMNHEGCCPGNVVPGRKPAFYMGDDATNEYLFKFVSATPWVAADANAADRLAIGDKYLDNGTLYVAKFNADGSGQWLPLVFGQNGLTSSSTVYPFADQADVLANARLAGDVLGATKMDRPEWTAVNPKTGEMYLTLTNNSTRRIDNTDAANPRYYNDPKGATNQRGNPNGHIIRLREDGDTTEATIFKWDIYLFGAGSDLDATNINLSGLDATNDLSSPDGLWFSRTTNPGGLVNPLLWIETDDGAYTDVTNCMLLCGMPGTVGDGGARTITNTGSDGVTTRTQATFVGKAPGTQLRRFLVGPKECEITGIDTTPDGRALFVNIQHPGENGGPTNITSNWPYSQTGASTQRPRSATIVITKADGGVIGL